MRPLPIAFIQKVSAKKVVTEEALRAVKLVEGSANLETCLAAMQGQGSTAPALPPTCTCQQQREKWNRRFACTRPNAAPLLFTDAAAASSELRPHGQGGRLRQPPCQGPTVEDVVFFFESFFKTRPGPVCQSLRSQLGEPATVLHFVTRVAA